MSNGTWLELLHARASISPPGSFIAGVAREVDQLEALQQETELKLRLTEGQLAAALQQIQELERQLAVQGEDPAPQH